MPVGFRPRFLGALAGGSSWELLLLLDAKAELDADEGVICDALVTAVVVLDLFVF